MANEVKRYLHDGLELPFEDWSKTLHSFNDLASIVQTTHDAAQSSAVKAINRMQTMRNWLIGYYIVDNGICCPDTSCAVAPCPTVNRNNKKAISFLMSLCYYVNNAGRWLIDLPLQSQIYQPLYCL